MFGKKAAASTSKAPAKASGAENAKNTATKADATPAGGGGKTQSADAAKADANTRTGAKIKQTQRGDAAPEAQKTQAAKRKATDKLFANADDAAARGLPPGLTVEQHENMQRRAALGF